ncbi:hypothetical protein SAMN04487965_0660 [Microbulbifer donghaiensis]|uniref:Uncharacterized protein n=1 Tax=Microbulbifer donghaiensis TaxID=494016 RepID=A0A1M4WCY8_9GAMM|nr:hypothetical protein SAMN04487965_0660 [Microbulbifer donghaiensis]
MGKSQAGGEWAGFSIPGSRLDAEQGFTRDADAESQVPLAVPQIIWYWPSFSIDSCAMR